MTNLATNDYWTRSYEGRVLHIAAPADPVRQWLEEYVPPDHERMLTALEIGCYPGRYLAVLGERGYELNGVDLAGDLPGLARWLESQGYRCGSFWQEDFMTFRPSRRFDLVMSLGFIEHWTNWDDMLRRHLELVGQGGLLVVEAPNFYGFFQRLIHAALDKENYRRHHVPSMDVRRWAELVRAHGFQLLFHGCFGRFDFWVERQRRMLWQKLSLKLLSRMTPILSRILPPDSRLWSPYAGLIARRLG